MDDGDIERELALERKVTTIGGLKSRENTCSSWGRQPVKETEENDFY